MKIKSSVIQKKREVKSSRGPITVTNYIVNVDEEMKSRCWKFAQDIIVGDNQYDRMLPANITNEQEKELIRIQRTYTGKLAEYALYKFLENMEKDVEIGSMFTIYEGQKNVDDYDFITKDNRTVDVKAAIRSNHKCLVVNLEQLDNIKKDFYVGIKLNATDFNKNLIYPDSITTAEIYGYCDDYYLNKQNTINLGEANCKSVNLDKLLAIDMLLNRF